MDTTITTTEQQDLLSPSLSARIFDLKKVDAPSDRSQPPRVMVGKVIERRPNDPKPKPYVKPRGVDVLDLILWAGSGASLDKTSMATSPSPVHSPISLARSPSTPVVHSPTSTPKGLSQSPSTPTGLSHSPSMPLHLPIGPSLSSPSRRTRAPSTPVSPTPSAFAVPALRIRSPTSLARSPSSQVGAPTSPGRSPTSPGRSPRGVVRSPSSLARSPSSPIGAHRSDSTMSLASSVSSPTMPDDEREQLQQEIDKKTKIIARLVEGMIAEREAYESVIAGLESRVRDSEENIMDLMAAMKVDRERMVAME